MGAHREVAVDTARFYTVTDQALNGGLDNLRLVPFTDVEWFVKDVGPRYLKMFGNGHETGEQAGLDPSGSGFGFRFMQNCHANGMTYGEACAAILADADKAGEWARRSDERQIKRAWQN